MKTVLLELPEALDARLEEAAGRRKIDKAQLVRVVLETYLVDESAATTSQNAEDKVSETGTQSVDPSRSRSFYEAIKDLAGCVEGPGDLSTNPKYMEGFGESRR